MVIKYLPLPSLKVIFKQPRTYEILLVGSLMAFIMTALSLAYTLHQPIVGPAYYTIDSSGQLQPATTIQASDWLSQSNRAVLGQQIERSKPSD